MAATKKSPKARSPVKKSSTPAKKTSAPRAARSKPFDLEARLAQLPETAGVEEPDMPVKVALLEANRLWAAASPDRKGFLAVPSFDIGDYDAVPHLIAALTDAERDWARARFAGRDVNLVQVRKEAEALRRKVMKAGSYLLRKDKAAMQELARISEGEGLADLVADLDDLVTFWGVHGAVLASDKRVPKDAPAQMARYAGVLRSGKDESAAIEAQARRNRVYAALQAAIGEVREAADFRFDDEPRRLAPYLSRYEADRKRARRRAQAEAKKNAPAADSKTPA